MGWVFNSTVMFLGSIVYYLVVKKLQKLGISKRVYMIVNQVMPIILFAVLVITGNKGFGLSYGSWGIVLLTSIILNYIGSLVSYTAIQEAPNAGYSVIIQKSYAIWTTIASVFLFGSELPWIKVVSIAIIIFFTAFIVVERSDYKFTVGKWFWLSLLAFFLFGGTTLTTKYVVILGDDSLVYLFWVMVVTTIVAILDYIRSDDTSIQKLNKNDYLWLLLASFVVTFFYWGKNRSTVTVPNVGYTGAINVASNAALVIASGLIYKEELKWSKVLAVIGVAVGLVMLVW